jgi:hypothetical protein
VGVAGRGESLSETEEGLCGDSIVMTGWREVRDTVLLDSSLGVVGNCVGVRPPTICDRSGRGSIRGLVFGLGGGCGEAVLAGDNMGGLPRRNELDIEK